MQSELDVSLPKQIIRILYESCRNQRRDNKYVGIFRNPNSWHSIPFVIERSVISLGVSQHVHKIKKTVKFLIQLVIERIIEEKKTLRRTSCVLFRCLEFDTSAEVRNSILFSRSNILVANYFF